ncbi:MAG: hypothetical protein QF819_04705 [Gemmatimonadota bacterium]|jgi:hypothetical protein|nr:hypothetical protein [Gemmatimonadota bacterium]MDP6529672.1 hypothetical protein [Gemmatimonadota bacterium]MDP6802459.1 hypothetical protein [Gemmatimonadota bacterium]MDP7030985.1 hypothetical protein [Gemmatimonadota bacterium]
MKTLSGLIAPALLTAALLSAGLAAPTDASARVRGRLVIRTPRPAPARVVVVAGPRAPRHHRVWVPGHWKRVAPGCRIRVRGHWAWR